MENIRILFFVNMNFSNRTGLFQVTHQRIKNAIDILESYKIYNVIFYDGLFIPIIKRLLNRQNEKLPKEKIQEYDGLTYYNIAIKKTILNSLLEYVGIDYLKFLKLKKILKNEISNYNLTHVHWAYPHGRVGYFLKKYFKIPYLLSLHGSDIHTIPHMDWRIKKYTVQNLNYADCNIFNSFNLLDEAKKLGYKKNNNVVIYNGIDTSRFYPITNEEKVILNRTYGLEPKSKVIGYIGNLVGVKGVDQIPAIFQNVKENIKDVKLLIVGDGPLKDLLKEELGTENNNVFFLGHVKSTHVRQIMSMLDILILPSNKEGFGQVILEAYSTGTNVIASRVGGIPEVIIDEKFTVPKNNQFVENISNKIIQELLKQSITKMELLQWVERKFLVEQQSKKEMEIIKIIYNEKYK